MPGGTFAGGGGGILLWHTRTAQTVPVEVWVWDLYALRNITDVRCTLSKAHGGGGIALHCAGLAYCLQKTYGVCRTVCTIVNTDRYR